jgi:peptidoglycan/xylan/chitin deacetylase (PgdA/CDA1 family)
MRPAAALPGLLAMLIGLTACGSADDTSPSPSASASVQGGVFTPSPTASVSVQPPASDMPSPSPSLDEEGSYYTVRAGDSLSSIARAYGRTSQQLQAWNARRYPSLLTSPNIIEPGWILVVRGDPDVTPVPTPSPRPAPPPTGIGCTAGNRVAAGSAQVYRTIPNAGPAVALTFDMGGRMDPAVDIMNFLVTNRVCATIFATGAMSQTAQGMQVTAIIRAHPELFEVGNHTMYHCDLVLGGGGSPTAAPCAGGPFGADRIRKELTDAEALLQAGTGQNPQPYWRPPYGSINCGVLAAAASAGYTKTFLWDIDTVDWKPITDGGPSAEQIAAKVVTNSVNGSNVLFHLGGYETLDALKLIVPGLRDRGMTLTSLSDLLN